MGGAPFRPRLKGIRRRYRKSTDKEDPTGPVSSVRVSFVRSLSHPVF